MNIDDLRRAWQHAADQTESGAQLVAAAPMDAGGFVLRGRIGSGWSRRRAFESALASALGEAADQVDLQWLAPRPAAPSPRDRARGRLGMAPRDAGPQEVGSRVGAGGPKQGGRVPTPQRVQGARRVIAVASGKGGVGKSTVAVNLALALRARGLSTGLLDADVYGPSMPTMLGSFAAPTRDGGLFQPPNAHGLPFLSLGLMVNPDKSVIWRGPLVQRMVRDMLQKTAWPGLDVLVIDLPPGTGDVQLSLVQRALLDGAVIVTTPQDIALIDAARGLEMFKRLDVPVLGLVENMASWSCPDCGSASHPFGHGGGEREAERLEVPFLGRVPMDGRVREAGDAGRPVVVAVPDAEASAAFAALAERVADWLDALEPATDPA
mgnify:FL=1